MYMRGKGVPRPTAVDTAMDASDGKSIKRRQRGGSMLFRIFRPHVLITVVLSLILLANCAYLGFLIGEQLADKYILPEAVKPIEDIEYTQLLKYPPPPPRRGIRRTP